jgi:hypothetical protein
MTNASICFLSVGLLSAVLTGVMLKYSALLSLLNICVRIFASHIPLEAGHPFRLGRLAIFKERVRKEMHFPSMKSRLASNFQASSVTVTRRRLNGAGLETFMQLTKCDKL